MWSKRGRSRNSSRGVLWIRRSAMKYRDWKSADRRRGALVAALLALLLVAADALAHARQSLAVDPEFWAGYYQLAQIHERRDRAGHRGLAHLFVLGEVGSGRSTLVLDVTSNGETPGEVLRRLDAGRPPRGCPTRRRSAYFNAS